MNYYVVTKRKISFGNLEETIDAILETSEDLIFFEDSIENLIDLGYISEDNEILEEDFFINPKDFNPNSKIYLIGDIKDQFYFFVNSKMDMNTLYEYALDIFNSSTRFEGEVLEEDDPDLIYKISKITNWSEEKILRYI